MIFHDALNIYTDGSSYSKPRRGGVGMLFVFYDDSGKEVQIERNLEGYTGATNNQMELQAVILALKEVPSIPLSNRVSRIVVITDSRYVTDNFKRAVWNWSKNEWRNQHGAPVANAVQWKDLIKTVRQLGMRVDFRWVKGHAKNAYNRQVDKLAKSSAKGLLQKPIQYTDLRRKKSREITEPGSVVMEGQRMTIRIISCAYEKLQRVFKLRYEVTSPKSKYFQKVDFIFSRVALRTGHIYYVVVNNEPKNPEIVKVIREIVKK